MPRVRPRSSTADSSLVGEPSDDREPGPEADPVAVAREICLQQLERGPRTRAQLAKVLQARRVPDDAAETVLGRLEAVGLVDDAAFAAAWVSSRHAGRGLARRALAHELRQRGVDGETVAEAVTSVDADEELAMARALVARRMPSLAGRPPQVRVRRLVGMLARKGYSAALAYRVVRELEGAAGGAGSLPGDDLPPSLAVSEE
jgi:regulatory protein